MLLVKEALAYLSVKDMLLVSPSSCAEALTDTQSHVMKKCFACLQGTPGLSFGKAEQKMGWNAQPTCAVMLDNVRVPAASLLGEEGKGFNIAMNACMTTQYLISTATDLTAAAHHSIASQAGLRDIKS